MPTDPPLSASAGEPAASEPGQKPPLSPAAQRALAEAAARRAEHERGAVAVPSTVPKEINGRGGLDPTRYGDWEVNGLASDF